MGDLFGRLGEIARRNQTAKVESGSNAYDWDRRATRVKTGDPWQFARPSTSYFRQNLQKNDFSQSSYLTQKDLTEVAWNFDLTWLFRTLGGAGRVWCMVKNGDLVKKIYGQKLGQW